MDNTDAIRYACCIIVLLSHIMTADNYLILGYGHFVCVTVFFLFSGYGLSLSFLADRIGCLKKYIGRMLKLGYPLIVVVILEVLLDVPVGQAGLWWINVLILFYVAFGISIAIFRDKYIVLLFNTIFILMYICFFQEVVAVKGISFSWTDYLGWPQQSIGFVLGIILAIWKEKILSFLYKYKTMLLTASVLVLLITGEYYARKHDISKITNEQLLIRNIISMSCIIIMLVFLQYFSLGNRIIVFVGHNLSIYIFALHGLLIGIVDVYYNGIDDNLRIGFIIMASLIGSLGMYYLKLGMTNIWILLKDRYITYGNR